MNTSKVKIIVSVILTLLMLIPFAASPVIAESQKVELTDPEIEDLKFIREEEKMARDVYLTLYDVWGLEIFKTIAASEQIHMDNALELLVYYGIEDPVPSDTVGDFSNTELAGYYADLTGWGDDSEADACLVGGFIEEFDILDLVESTEQTDVKKLDQVYTNMYEASCNHLVSFAFNYENLTGDEYVGWIMDDETLESYMNLIKGKNKIR